MYWFTGKLLAVSVFCLLLLISLSCFLSRNASGTRTTTTYALRIFRGHFFCLNRTGPELSLHAHQCHHPRMLSGPVLRNTARLFQRYPPMGFLVSQHGQLGAIPPPPFLSVSPLESMRSGGAIPPPTKGVSQRYLCHTL